MKSTIKIADRRYAFTLIEMLVVITIILALAALAAAFAPRVSQNQAMTRAVDNVEQWLLTAKMRAKRDRLSTGVRFIQAPGDLPGSYSQFQYIQQPPPLAGGVCVGPPPPVPPPPLPGVYQYPPGTGNYYTGGLLTSAAAGVVNFAPGSIDFTLGLITPPLPNQWLVQAGDYLEINGGGVFYIAAVTGQTTLQLGGTATYFANLTIPASGTTNFRILRQPRILIGEEPLALPNNYAVNMNFAGSTVSPGLAPSLYQTPAGWNQLAPPFFYYDIVFSPTGAVVGTNAGSGIIAFVVQDMTMNPFDPQLAGIVGIQSRTGFIGTYNLSPVPPFPSYFSFVTTGRESGL